MMTLGSGVLLVNPALYNIEAYVAETMREHPYSKCKRGLCRLCGGVWRGRQEVVRWGNGENYEI